MSTIDFSVIEHNWRYLFETGMVFTLQLTGFAMAGGLVFGIVLALMRLSSFAPFSVIATTYVNVIRSIPLVLMLFWFYFLVPYIGAWLMGADEPIQVGAFMSALITFTLYEAAYFCEIMRSGIQSIPRGQIWAAQALGMRYAQTMRLIILPQALRMMLPVLLTQIIILFQDVSLVYVLSLPDFVGAASKIAQRDGRVVEMYLFVALVYFVLCFSLSLFTKKVQNKFSHFGHD